MYMYVHVLAPPPPDDEIRECVFLSLDKRFDPHLAQAENLTTLFVAVHDGVSRGGGYTQSVAVHDGVSRGGGYTQSVAVHDGVSRGGGIHSLWPCMTG